MIFAEAVYHRLEGDDACGGEDSRLAHSAAEEFALTVGALDEFARSADDGADGGGESFAEAEGERVDVLGEGFHVHVLGGGGVEDARSVEVDFESVLLGKFADLLEIAGGLEDSAAAVVGVFERDEARGRVMRIGSAQPRFEVGEEKRAVGLVRQLSRVNSAQRGDASRFVEEGVGFVAEHDFVAALAVGEDGGEVAHGAAWDVEGGFFACAGGGEFLQAVDGGVFGVYVVADGGFGHGFAHGGGGVGEGIGAEVCGVHVSSSRVQVLGFRFWVSGVGADLGADIRIVCHVAGG